MPKFTKHEETLPLRKLPVGVTEFNELVKDLMAHPEMPTADEDSVIFAVSSIIMHSEPGDDALPLEFFIRHLRAGAAKQVAHSMFQEIKLKQQAKVAAEAAVDNEHK